MEHAALFIITMNKEGRVGIRNFRCPRYDSCQEQKAGREVRGEGILHGADDHILVSRRQSILQTLTCIIVAQIGEFSESGKRSVLVMSSLISYQEISQVVF